MFRFIVSFSLAVTLCINYPNAGSAKGADAFAIITSDMSTDPTTRSFLQGIAKKLKKDWFDQPVLPVPSVTATFATDKGWQIHSISLTNVAINYPIAEAKATQLVEGALHGINPPHNQPMTVLFVFDTPPVYSPAAASKTTTNSTSGGDVDFGPYMASLQRKVKSNWNLIKEPQKKTKTVVIFTISKDGSIKDVRLTTKSNSSEYDNAALNAVKHSAPFLPLPSGSEDNIDIQYTFEHQLHAKSKHNDLRGFTVHLSQPGIVVPDSSASEYSGHFRTF